jgi:hypothetical protein
MEVYLHAFLTSALDRGGQFQAQTALLPEKEPQARKTGSWVSPKRRSEHCEDDKKSLSPARNRNRLPSCPARSPVTNWVNPVLTTDAFNI